MNQLRALGRSFVNAGRGIFACIKNERNMRIHLCMAFYVLTLMPFYHFTRGERAAVFICIGAVTSLEALNTAIEAAIDLVSPEKHPLAKLAKDAAAGAVLFAAAASALVGGMFYLDPEVLSDIFGWFASRPIWAALFVLSVIGWTAVIFVPCVRKEKGNKS